MLLGRTDIPKCVCMCRHLANATWSFNIGWKYFSSNDVLMFSAFLSDLRILTDLLFLVDLYFHHFDGSFFNMIIPGILCSLMLWLFTRTESMPRKQYSTYIKIKKMSQKHVSRWGLGNARIRQCQWRFLCLCVTFVVPEHSILKYC